MDRAHMAQWPDHWKKTVLTLFYSVTLFGTKKKHISAYRPENDILDPYFTNVNSKYRSAAKEFQFGLGRCWTIPNLQISLQVGVHEMRHVSKS